MFVSPFFPLSAFGWQFNFPPASQRCHSFSTLCLNIAYNVARYTHAAINSTSILPYLYHHANVSPCLLTCIRLCWYYSSSQANGHTSTPSDNWKWRQTLLRSWFATSWCRWYKQNIGTYARQCTTCISCPDYSLPYRGTSAKCKLQYVSSNASILKYLISATILSNSNVTDTSTLSHSHVVAYGCGRVLW